MWNAIFSLSWRTVYLSNSSWQATFWMLKYFSVKKIHKFCVLYTYHIHFLTTHCFFVCVSSHDCIVNTYLTAFSSFNHQAQQLSNLTPWTAWEMSEVEGWKYIRLGLKIVWRILDWIFWAKEVHNRIILRRSSNFNF